MFTQTDRKWFNLAASLMVAGFLSIAFDPEANGFGLLTLWVAPPLLLGGFLSVIPGLLGRDLKFPSVSSVTAQPLQYGLAAAAFCVSLLVYLITLEPTASLWDCAEFIASSYKLQVPHTPGNPLLLLIGRIFSMFSFGDVTAVAKCINAMSAIFSAATVVLVYFLIIHLGRRMRSGSGSIALYISAFAGSLCLAFSDSFWFSAVEAETYAASCFFLFLLMLLILHGATLEEEPRQRVLILIFYLGGLAFCIHPMCVLALPLLPVVWYMEKRKLTLKAFVLPLIVGAGIVLFINRFIAIGIFEVAFHFDRVLVNGLGAPFYTGAIVLIGILIFGFRFFIRRFPSKAHYTYSLIFLLAGFLPYCMLFLRSNHNPPIDESNPENLQLIKAYMNREGYPTRPLVYGPYFDAEVTDVEAAQTVYYKAETAYKVAGSISEYSYEKGRQTFLPRIYSNDPAHVSTYQRWTGLKPGERPDFIDNVVFMFRYQLGHMYGRYLMFNFAGRESDEQNSNWLTPLDERKPYERSLQNAARNQYWMVPLLIGLAGAYIQFTRDGKGLLYNTTVFLMTGALLVVYLNSTPNEPRERDYIYVGSYVAFSVWIGLGIFFIAESTGKKFKYFALAMLFIVPVWMLFENFDDHDRSGRTFQIDNAKNILASCAPNGILFTGGDNDTFPLWYVQEVEGFRTDVRVVVLSYLNTDWYINQLRNNYYDSTPFRFSLSAEDYRQYGPNDVLYIHEQLKNGFDAAKFLGLLHQQHPGLQVKMQNGEFYNSLPSGKIFLTSKTDHESSDSSKAIQLNVTGRFLSKNGLAIMDLLTNNSDRQFYFNFTSMQQTGFDIENHLVDEGQVYRVILSGDDESTNEDELEVSYRNLVGKGNYENLLDEQVHFNYEDYELRIIQPLRQSFNALAFQFMQHDKPERALEVLATSMRYFYRPDFTPSIANLQAAKLLIELDKKPEAESLAKALYTYNNERIMSGNNGEAERQLREFASEILSSLADEAL
jgi:hypothetical protein